MYLQSKYTSWYYKIINSAKNRAISKYEARKLVGYCEKHHIIPKSLGGLEEDNIGF